MFAKCFATQGSAGLTGSWTVGSTRVLCETKLVVAKGNTRDRAKGHKGVMVKQLVAIPSVAQHRCRESNLLLGIALLCERSTQEESKAHHVLHPMLTEGKSTIPCFFFSKHAICCYADLRDPSHGHGSPSKTSCLCILQTQNPLSFFFTYSC